MIKTIDITNFGPIKSAKIDATDKNVYIVGPNGTGKSHILRAIAFACTGKHGKTNNIDGLIGPYGKDFKIKIKLFDDSVITRTSKTAYLELPDGTSYKKMSDVQDNLPFDPILFYNVAFVKQGKISEFFQKDVGKSVIEKLVSLIIDNKVLNEGYKELLSKEKEITSVYNSIQAVIEDLSKTNYDEDIAQLINQINELEKQIQNVNIQYIEDEQKVHNKFKEVTMRYNHCIEELDKLKLQTIIQPSISLNELSNQKKKYESYIQLLQKKDQLVKECDKFEKLIPSIEYVKMFFGLDTTLVKTAYTPEQLNEIAQYKKQTILYMTTSEYTDSQTASGLLDFYKKNGHIDANTIAKEKEKYEKIKPILQEHTEVLQLLKQYTPNENNVEEIINKLYTKHKTDLQNILTDINNIGEIEEVTDTELYKLSQQWTMYETYTQRLTTLMSQQKILTEEMTQITSSKTMSEEQLESAKNIINNINAVQETISTKKSMLNMLTQNRDRLESSKIEKDRLETKIQKIATWKEILKDMPGKLRASLLNPVAYHLNKDFQELFSFTLGEIKVDWDQMDIILGDKNIQQLSGAQEVALGLTIHLALLKAMGSKVPIMLIDEPTQFMDQTRINEVKTYLSYLGKQTQMWICTHDENIIDNINSIIVDTANFS